MSYWVTAMGAADWHLEGDGLEAPAKWLYKENAQSSYALLLHLCSNIQTLGMPFSLVPQECRNATASSFTPKEPHSGYSLLSNSVKWIPHSGGGLQNTELRDEHPSLPSCAVRCSVQVRVVEETMRVQVRRVPRADAPTCTEEPASLHFASLGCLWGPSALFSRCLHTASWQQACSSAN